MLEIPPDIVHTILCQTSYTSIMHARPVSRVWKAVAEDSLLLKYLVWCGIYHITPFSEKHDYQITMAQRLSSVFQREVARRTLLNVQDGWNLDALKISSIPRRDTFALEEEVLDLPLLILPANIPRVSQPPQALLGDYSGGAPTQLVGLPPTSHTEFWSAENALDDEGSVMLGVGSFIETIDFDLDLLILSDL
ncbi:hypothetical protein DL93DRAFT_1494956 [Clavulina sp. PMI_390]|nr:hypothetical protein DL93DRAFT_1494956 [Clavulina sp. PMI_390]